MKKDNDVYKIHLFQEQIKIDCPENSTILMAALSARVNHAHACGARAKCSTCRVSVLKGLNNCSPRNKAEEKMAKKLNFPPDIRLACQTTITGDVSIRRMVSDRMDMDIILEQFYDGPEKALGTQQKVTIVFIDIANYTSLAEKFPPYDTVHVLNRYYRIMNAIIEKHKGFISDVAGDGILAVFGTENKRANSVLNAINAVKSMNKKLQGFNKYLKENFNVTFGIRAGIHYGKVIMGPFDTGSMKKISVIGDSVNYASRIETANKAFGTTLLLSENAYSKVEKKYPKYKIYETPLKGKTGTYKLYELLELNK